MSYPLAARLTDNELEAIRAVWSAASGRQWRVEAREKYTKLYAVCPPHMHDLYLMDLSAFDANGAANVAAIAAAPEHVEHLLAAYETLRDHVDDVQRNWEEHLMSVPAGPQWSREKPAAPGAYWVRGEGLTDGIARLIEVDCATGELGLHLGSTHYYVSDLDGEWCGPLTPPA